MDDRLTILLVDNQTANFSAVLGALPSKFFQVVAARSTVEGAGVARRLKPDVILLSSTITEPDTRTVVEEFNRIGAAPVILLGESDKPSDRVRALEAGAVDLIKRPLVAPEVSIRVKNHARRAKHIHSLEVRNRRLEHQLKAARRMLEDVAVRDFGVLEGESRAICELRKLLDLYAVEAAPVLMDCPPGAGAEPAARLIHQNGRGRSGHPFLRLSPALSHDEPSAETLFSQRDSPYWLAGSGTLFVDYVTELPRPAQQDLVRLLRASSDDPRRPRVIAAVRGGLDRALSSGRLNSDLFRLFSGNLIRLPPLVERSEDLPILIDRLVRSQADRLGRPLTGVTPVSLELALQYHWPGNYDELRNLIERLALVSRGPLIDIPEDQLCDDGVGSYRLIRKLGEGGMGVIWEAEHRMLSRSAAVKIIRNEFTTDDERREFLIRFEREARATAHLSSPHTVTLFDYGITREGAPYYVMEKLDGIDLDEFVDRHGVMAPGRVVRVLAQACLSLAEAHAVGLIHRDIKPGNLALCRVGAQYDFTKVLDFGLTKSVCDTRQTTNPALLVGTPGYMAPEYISHGVIDARSDLYSLAAVGYFLISGRPLFDGRDTVRLLAQHTEQDPHPLSEVCEPVILKDLDELFQACLSRDPTRRPATALELAESLENLGQRLPWTSRQAEYWWNNFEPRKPEDSSWLYPSTHDSTSVEVINPE